MHFRDGFEKWWSGLQFVHEQTQGIERVVNVGLYSLALLSLTQWLHIGFRSDDERVSPWIDVYVVSVLVLSAVIYCLKWTPDLGPGA
jgi:hypothetical protein